MTTSVPHIQVDQTSEQEMYDRLVEWAFRDDRVAQVPTRASLPGALGLTVAAGRSARGEAMIVAREFAHIHQRPGAGSLHLRLPADQATEVVAKGWGEWHPFALNGSSPGLVMVFAPRSDSDLDVIKVVIASATDHATSPG